MVLKTFIFILVVQVKYTDGLSVDPDAVKDITSTFPGKIRVTDWLNTHSGMSPVSLRRTQVRLKARGGYFLYQNYALWSIFHFLSCFNTNGVFLWSCAHQPSAWISCPADSLDLCS